PAKGVSLEHVHREEAIGPVQSTIITDSQYLDSSDSKQDAEVGRRRYGRQGQRKKTTKEGQPSMGPHEVLMLRDELSRHRATLGTLLGAGGCGDPESVAWRQNLNSAIAARMEEIQQQRGQVAAPA
ncbi:MAG: hypothetical protein ACKPKO_10605, partial [Candidatus Fonsibacter sp.]